MQTDTDWGQIKGENKKNSGPLYAGGFQRLKNQEETKNVKGNKVDPDVVSQHV
jgi:hypothetical protein